MQGLSHWLREWGLHFPCNYILYVEFSNPGLILLKLAFVAKTVFLSERQVVFFSCSYTSCPVFIPWLKRVWSALAAYP